MLTLKAGAIIPLALGTIAVLDDKALLIALLLASITGLKEPLSGRKTVTYETVGHPHHANNHEQHTMPSLHAVAQQWFGGCGRSSDAQEMLYRAYAPKLTAISNI